MLQPETRMLDSTHEQTIQEPGVPLLLLSKAGAAATNAGRAEEIAVICHELNNSLAVFRGAARLLRSPASADSIDSARSLIERHTGQMTRHILDLLQPRRRAEQGPSLQLARVDLRVIARFAGEANAPEMVRRGHHFTISLPDQPVWALADGARLEQAFSNLLINAAKYTPEGGSIAMIMERSEEQVSVRVRDSGVGIEPEMLSRVFGMFVQVDAEVPSAATGRGIGLAVVRNLVEMHGGTVRAESAGLGLGSEFIVELPIRTP